MQVKKEKGNVRTTELGHLTLERRVFDSVEFIFVGARITIQNGYNLVVEGCVRG